VIRIIRVVKSMLRADFAPPVRGVPDRYPILRAAAGVWSPRHHHLWKCQCCMGMALPWICMDTCDVCRIFNRTKEVLLGAALFAWINRAHAASKVSTPSRASTHTPNLKHWTFLENANEMYYMPGTRAATATAFVLALEGNITHTPKLKHWTFFGNANDIYDMPDTQAATVAVVLLALEGTRSRKAAWIPNDALDLVLTCAKQACWA